MGISGRLSLGVGRLISGEIIEFGFVFEFTRCIDFSVII